MNKKIHWDITLDLEGKLLVQTIFNNKRYRAYVYVGKVGPENIHCYKGLINYLKRFLIMKIRERNSMELAIEFVLFFTIFMLALSMVVIFFMLIKDLMRGWW